MYQILMISSLYIVFKLCNYIIDVIDKIRVKRNLLGNPILRYEYYKSSYTSYKIRRLKRMAYKDYLQTKHWQLVHTAVLKRDQNRCADCGETLEHKPLEVHHITYIRRGKENLDDMMTLCRDCHQERHFVSTAFE